MPSERTLIFHHRNIFYRVVGNGPAVFMLHGIPANGSLWQNQLNSLTGYTLIAPDLPGSGNSEMVADMSVEGMAEVIKAIFDKENLSLATLVGHSLGGYIALAFAEKYQQCLSGLGLFHSTAYADSDERKEIRRKAIVTVQHSGASNFLTPTVPNLFSPKAPETGAMAGILRNANNFSSQTLVSYYRAMLQRPDRTSILKELKIPVLFIAGKFDGAVLLDDSLRQCYIPERSDFHILMASGHMGMLEEPDLSGVILQNYLDLVSNLHSG